ncbi:hypothetical protein SteCoe_31635 [Stentor coeruleus]|uniref:Uncharacterized protein n=1 Tax=Stentor coeruleus TaxID=5963 RepID=A0A1R2B0U9_9CILI|nr:hypothetical protein SteCoe_31635 [Stentor coeruleus]
MVEAIFECICCLCNPKFLCALCESGCIHKCLECPGECVCGICSCMGQCCNGISLDCIKDSCSGCFHCGAKVCDTLCACKIFEGECCMQIEGNCMSACSFASYFSMCSIWFQNCFVGFSNLLMSCAYTARCCIPGRCLLTIGYDPSFTYVKNKNRVDNQGKNKKQNDESQIPSHVKATVMADPDCNQKEIVGNESKLDHEEMI